MRVTVGADAIEGPGGVAYQACIEAEIAGHARRGLDAVIGGGAADHHAADICRAQATFEVGTDEGAVDALDDDGLAVALARLVLHRKAAAARPERRGRAGAFMA